MQNNQKPGSDITVTGLLSSLRPAQLWSIAVITFGLLGGSFGLGYKAHSFIAESEIAKYENKIATLEIKSKQFLGLQTKERFLAFYLRYVIAKNAHEASPSEETRLDVQRIGDNLLRNPGDCARRLVLDGNPASPVGEQI